MKENQIKGVMTELVEKKERKSSFDVFLSTEDIPLEVIHNKSVIGQRRFGINKILVEAKQQYARIIRAKETQELFEKMAEIETTIIQARCALVTETKLTMVNQKRGGSETSYVVARAPFYNPDNVKAEIRVYLGKAEDLGSDLVKLSSDQSFMDRAENLVVKAMMEVMVKSGALKSIKKSELVKVLMTNEGDEEAGISGSLKKEKRMDPRRSPFTPKNPGQKLVNPNPKGSRFWLGGGTKDKK